MKFVLFVEGHTEKAIPSFLKRWIDPQLNQRVRIQPVVFEGWSEFRRKISRSASMHLNGPDSEQIIGAIGLLDLYGLDLFPDHISSTRDRHDWAVAHFQREVSHPKFRMFFAVHEIEAWILSQPHLLRASVQTGLPASRALPETVNFKEPPAKLLDRLYRTHTGRGYRSRSPRQARPARRGPLGGIPQNVSAEAIPAGLDQRVGTI